MSSVDVDLQPLPFSVNVRLVVSGGWLAEPWVPDVQYIDSRPFVKLSPYDRKLARALGQDMNVRDPWADKSIFSHLEKLRDDSVDELIHAARVRADPMADTSNASTRS